MQKEKIFIDRQSVDYLIKQREDPELRKLTPEERRQTIDAFVEDEILYSEAYKRGLDKGDTRMRRNLILKMRGLLIGDIDKPTEEELRAYFEANRADFDYPVTVSLDHVFFSDPAHMPKGLVEKLRGGLDPTTLGEAMLGLGRSLPRMSQQGLVGVLGPDAARAILDTQDEQWHGPFESIHGAHFVRIIGRGPARRSSYEEVAPVLSSYVSRTKRLAEIAAATQSEGILKLVTVCAPDQRFLSADSPVTSSPYCPLRRSYPKEEPGALVAHAGTCAGGAG